MLLIKPTCGFRKNNLASCAFVRCLLPLIPSRLAFEIVVPPQFALASYWPIVHSMVRRLDEMRRTDVEETETETEMGKPVEEDEWKLKE